MTLLFLLTLGCATKKDNSNKEEFSLFTTLKDPFETMAFISASDTYLLNESQKNALIDTLKADNLYHDGKDSFRVGNNFKHCQQMSEILTLKSKDGKEWLFLSQISNPDKLNVQWEEIKNLIDIYSGISNLNKGILYMKLEAKTNSSLNATFRSENSIINLGIELPFKIYSMDSLLSNHQEVIYQNSLDKLIHRLEILQNALVSYDQLVYKLRKNQTLTADERLFGLIQFWTEVKYNFVFSERLNSLNWNKLLQEYLPKIKSDQSNYEYYKLLQKLCATLKDGHTNVYFPRNIDIKEPSVNLQYLDGKVIVTNIVTNLQSTLPIGSEIISIEGTNVNNYLENQIIPFISSSTDHILKEQSVRELLIGPANSEVKITFVTPDSITKETTLKRNFHQGSSAWVKSKSNHSICEFKILSNNIAYISLNSFNSIDIVESFETFLDTISKSKSLIIDLRNNGGGNSTYGYEILKYFTRKPFLTSTWSTREHKPAFKAWGVPYKYRENNDLNKFELLAKQNCLGTNMYLGTPDTIIPNKKRLLEKPLVVLIGSNTASAAEDFLIALDQLKIATTIGSVTYGSTGQPLMIKLPGGGSARICTKKDSYPDGREFVGFGIKPDIEIKETIESVLMDQDIVLDAALNYLKKK